MLVQLPIDPSNLDFDKIDTLQKEIEQVYHFERDVATARVQDAAFDGTVGKINDYMDKYRRTYEDREYNRDPIDDNMKRAERRNADAARRQFEASKQALDL